MPATTDPYRSRVDGLVERLPGWLARRVKWLLLPESRWARLPAGVLLIIGSVLAILPVFGLWMLPLGVLLLAEDVPLFQRWASRMFDWIERRRPNWLGHVPMKDAQIPNAGDRRPISKQ
jgi:hypothetical protein